MGSRTIYSCDSCGEEVNEYSDLTKLELRVKPNIDTYTEFYSMELCKECINYLGINLDTRLLSLHQKFMSIVKKFIEIK